LLAEFVPCGLFFYAPSKEALLEAVLERSIRSVMSDVRAAVDALPEKCSSREKFCVAIAAHVRSIILHGDFALASRRVIGQIPASMRRKHAAMRSEYGDYWQGLFLRAAQSGHMRTDTRLGLARMFLMGALNWTTEWFDPKKKTPEEIAAVFCSFLFDGLGTPESIEASARQA
jgi:AcrR family transcriptional regulator